MTAYSADSDSASFIHKPCMDDAYCVRRMLKNIMGCDMMSPDVRLRMSNSIIVKAGEALMQEQSGDEKGYLCSLKAAA